MRGRVEEGRFRPLRMSLLMKKTVQFVWVLIETPFLPKEGASPEFACPRHPSDRTHRIAFIFTL